MISFSGFTLDVIGKCAFGIETDACRRPEQEFVKTGAEMFEDLRTKNWIEAFFGMLINHFPSLMKYMPIFPAAYDKFHVVTKGIISARKKARTSNDDFVATLMELQKVVREEPDSETGRLLNDTIIMAQGVVFFTAGFETTANTLCTLCYNLAKNPDIQDKVYEEIASVMEGHGNRIDHETISEMKYLDAAIQEDLRRLGPVIMHLRSCVKDCEV